MREALTSGKFLKLAGMMLAAAALLLTSLAAATAQERPRTLFDLLFGSRQAQPQRQYERPAPQRVKPKPKRPRASSPAARAAAPSAAAPAVEIATKKPDAKKILVVGDFIGNGLAEGLDAAFATDPDLTVATRVNGSSGFVRDDYFNWPDNIGKILDEEKPAAVVVMIGANDRQAITANGNSLQPRSPEWNAEYQKRVAAFTKVISDRHYPLVWVGQPPFRPKGMSQDMLALNEIYRNAAEKAGGKFADVWDGFVDEEGNSLPATHSLDPSKPVDRVAPVSLRDINKDDSGILLGGTPAMQAKPLKPSRKKPTPRPDALMIFPGRAMEKPPENIQVIVCLIINNAPA
ncbi:hypothetical protein B989_03038 [Brucella sp. 56/94]|nr:hypothetical protein B989_03038 [Brucella sp. 56/94]QPF77774.1 DUF459 domain-containing protein [Brucella pinnipedialis]